MTDIENKILEMLEQGLPYSQIQESLHVSSKTITATKKAHFPLQEINKNMVYPGHTRLIPDLPSVESEDNPTITVVELKELNDTRAAMKNELDQLERELQLKRSELDSIKKMESERRLLIRQTKMLSQSCQDKDYTYDEIDNLMNGLNILVKDCEKYCTDNDIEFEDSECLKILKKIEGNLAEFLCSFDPDDYDEMELVFDYALRDLQKSTTFNNI